MPAPKRAWRGFHQQSGSDIGRRAIVVYAEAKGNGFDTKVIRKIIRMRKQDASDRAEEEALLATYLRALGMQTNFDFGDE